MSPEQILNAIYEVIQMFSIPNSIAMVFQGMADGILVSNMRSLTNDEEEASKWIGAFSKAGGAIYSVDDGKLEFHFKGDKPHVR